MNYPIISVIVPVYNAELYLKRCINSITTQTYQKLEIILINDGSTDNSLNICHELAQTDKRIKVINQKNRGVSYTRNQGINKATGEYLLFVDSDDFIDTNYINKMYQELKNNHYEIVISGMTFCDEKENIIKKELYKKENQELKLDNIIDDVINTLYFCSACKTIISKKLITNNNLQFNEELSYGEDFSFSYQLLKRASKIGYLSDTGYYYRQNSTSLTHKTNIEKIKKYFSDNLVVFSQFDNSTLVANRVYTKLNITIRKIASIEKINYKKFKSLTLEMIDLYNSSNITKDINLEQITYESKVNKKLLKYLKNNQFYKYYITIKFIALIKNILKR